MTDELAKAALSYFARLFSSQMGPTIILSPSTPTSGVSLVQSELQLKPELCQSGIRGF